MIRVVGVLFRAVERKRAGNPMIPSPNGMDRADWRTLKLFDDLG